VIVTCGDIPRLGMWAQSEGRRIETEIETTMPAPDENSSMDS